MWNKLIALIALSMFSNNIALADNFFTLAEEGEYKAVKRALKKNKIDINKRDTRTNLTALQLLCRTISTVNGEQAGPNYYPAFTAQLLLSYGANPNILFKDGNSCLTLVAPSGKEKFIEKLLLYGAKKSHKTVNGKTAYLLAKESPKILINEMRAKHYLSILKP